MRDAECITFPQELFLAHAVRWIAVLSEVMNMRKIICAMVFAASVGVVSAVSGIAAPIGLGVPPAADHENALQQVQSNRCDRLRRACENKDIRGEEGMGNCRRYRDECGGRRSYCDRLRRACENKDERGERGEGNCRRYREECR